VGKKFSGSTTDEFAIRGEHVNELQHFIAPCPARLVPYPVGYDTRSDSQSECGQQPQLSASGESSCSEQKTRRRYWQTYLASENGCKEYGIAMPQDEMDDRIYHFGKLVSKT